MRTFVAATLLVGCLVPGSSSEAGPVARGLLVSAPQEENRCGLASAGLDVQQGLVQGGPVSGVTTGFEASITCTIQVGAMGATHAGPDYVRLTSDPAPLAVIPPTTVRYEVPPEEVVFLCTEITIGNLRYYWDDVTDGFEPTDSSAYSPSNSARCSLAFTQEVDVTWTLPEDVVLLVDELVCPVLAIVFPVEGDVPGIWDCPPYWN